MPATLPRTVPADHAHLGDDPGRPPHLGQPHHRAVRPHRPPSLSSCRAARWPSRSKFVRRASSWTPTVGSTSPSHTSPSSPVAAPAGTGIRGQRSSRSRLESSRSPQLVPLPHLPGGRHLRGTGPSSTRRRQYRGHHNGDHRDLLRTKGGASALHPGCSTALRKLINGECARHPRRTSNGVSSPSKASTNGPVGSDLGPPSATASCRRQPPSGRPAGGPRPRHRGLRRTKW